MKLRHIMISKVSSSKLTARPAMAMEMNETTAPDIQITARHVSEIGCRTGGVWAVVIQGTPLPPEKCPFRRGRARRFGTGALLQG
ncbi:hypothetical protein GCM10011534_10360 [Pseudooceanicola nanhaiensis]|uniref:Uncharacterized protein n=1 Tax=Pseudooceanicola nanhaiensis TaxID=375761 RepID=A0A917SQU6_9RHOB|nr:hypothetical protein GCM10011534_10360 [Pseudooceanicola nanhaiensis]